MITQEQLRDLFESWTNIHVTLYHGDVREEYRDVNDIITPVNGVMRVDAWTYTPIKYVSMATTEATVTVIARTDKEANDFASRINESLEDVRGSTITVVGDDGRAYSLAVMAGSAYRDDAIHSSNYGRGDEIDIVVRIQFIATAHGVNSADTLLLIDGEQIEIENITSAMVSATDDQPGDDGVTVSATPSKTLQIECSAILLDNRAGDIILGEGLDLDKKGAVRCVEYAINGKSRYYMMAFTRCQIGSAELNNVGVSFSLATANPDAMELDARWHVVRNVGIFATVGAHKGSIVFWGDHSASKVESGNMATHTYVDGVDDHIIRIFGEYDAPTTRELRIGDDIAGKRIIYMGDDWDVSQEVDTTLITTDVGTLKIESGYLREMRDDYERLLTITDNIVGRIEWRSTLGRVTGIRDDGMWHVYVSEMGV